MEGEAHVHLAELKSNAKKININSELELLKKKQELELSYMEEIDNLTIEKEKQLAEIEAEKF